MAISITPSPFGSVTVTLDGELGGVLSVGVLATSNSALNMDLGVPGPAGEQGPAGEAGEPGSNGQGVAPGGLINQVLVKLSNDDFDTGWANGGAGGDFLPLSGGTMSGAIRFDSVGTQNIAKGSFDSGRGGYNGISLNCAVDYELNWQAGYLKALNSGGFTVPINVDESSIVILGGAEATNGLTIQHAGITGDELYHNAHSEFTPDNINLIVEPVDGGDSGFNAHLGAYDGFNQQDIYGNTISVNATYGITFPNSSIQTTAFPGYTGTSAEYIDGTGALETFPPLGDRYLTSSNSTLTCDSGNGKTMTVGTGLSYSRQQDITVSYNNSNHMHGTVLTYDSATGVMTFDSNTHSGGGTYSSWEVNVGGVAGAVLPVGGTSGQVLAKINSTNFNTEWVSLGTMSTEPASAYLSTASAVANYLTISSASSTYQTQSGMSAYLSTASAVANYLTISSASSTYQTISGMSAYLSTSAAASTYQTQSGMSAYLSTASAVANYQTIAGMSAYLSTTSASANFIGTSAYATTAQAQAGTSTTTVVSPATLLDAKWFAGGKSMVQITWSTSVSGAGASASAQNSNARLNIAPTTATGYAISSAVIANNSRGTIYNSGFDFSKRVAFGLRVARNVASPDTASVWRFSIGKSSGTDASDISAKGLQVKVAGSGALQLLVHNGTTLTTTTSSYTPANGVSYDIVVTSDGAGNCVLYVNGTSVATSTGGPTTAGLANAGFMMFEVQNTSVITGSPQNICITDYFVQVNS